MTRARQSGTNCLGAPPGIGTPGWPRFRFDASKGIAMTDAKVLRELADEVERLDGSSRDMDARIWLAMHPESGAFNAGPLYLGYIAHGDWPRPMRAPSCTDSVDVAADLMPAAWRRRIDIFAKGGRGREEDGRAKTEALARTACALRALAADLEGMRLGRRTAMDKWRDIETALEELDTLDRAEVLEGYFDGRAGEPEPGDNRSRSYWHGWRNGALDGGHRKKDEAQAALARAYLAAQTGEG